MTLTTTTVVLSDPGVIRHGDELVRDRLKIDDLRTTQDGVVGDAGGQSVGAEQQKILVQDGPLPQFHIHQGLDPDRAGQHMFVCAARRASASVSSPERTCSCTREWSLVSN